MIIIDSHEDLAWNMLTFGRDYTRSAAETRQRERGSEIPLHNGDTLLGWPEYQRGRVAVIFSTLFAAPIRTCEGEWDTQCYRDFSQANRMYRAQLDVYYRLVDENPDKFMFVQTGADLSQVLSEWQQVKTPVSETDPPHVGLVLLMECAEAIQHPAELEEWWERGVRIIGPAWAGTRFCGGTREPGPMTSDGFALLDGMADLGFALDLSHMDEKAALQALEHYPGILLASHANARSLLSGVDSNRHLTDRVLRGLLERQAVIGVVPYNAFLLAGWKKGDRKELVTLQHLATQIDYICQMAGDAAHVGIGTDFDGGFGMQATPLEIDTIVDLHKLAALLGDKGYSQENIEAILGKNWLNCLHRLLPEGL
jgi:membrane dipeptidase